MKLFLTLALSAPFLSSSVMAAPSDAAAGPRPGTVEAMRCLVGQAPKGCGNMFVGHAEVLSKPWVFASPEASFQRGPLVSSNYLGRASGANMFAVKSMRGMAAKEMDMFEVKYAHYEYTFYISPADADGKIRALNYAPP